MDSSHYQIHIARIIQSPSLKTEYLTCNICRNILWQPEKCRDCQAHFCRFCIVFSLLKSKKCPQCLLEYQSKSPDSFLLEDLLDLKIKCFFTYNGCNQILSYDSILKHENECNYREQNCEECNKKILKKNYHTHIIMCKNSLPDNMTIDFRQILIYFHDKLEKIDKDNQEDLEKIKKQFEDACNQKQNVLQTLILRMDKQRKIMEEIAFENEKRKSMTEEEMKMLNNYNFGNANVNNSDKNNNCSVCMLYDDQSVRNIMTGNEQERDRERINLYNSARIMQ